MTACPPTRSDGGPRPRRCPPRRAGSRSSGRARVIASGSGPPNDPLCCGARQHVDARPRVGRPRGRWCPIVGTPGAVVPAVGDHRDVGARAGPRARRPGRGRCSVEHSSSPSTRTLIVQGGDPSRRTARSAAAWMAMPALVVGRARGRRGVRRGSAGSNGGVVHGVRIAGRLDVVVGVQQRPSGARRGPAASPKTAGCPPSSSSSRASSKPALARISRRELGAGSDVRGVVARVADRGDPRPAARGRHRPRHVGGGPSCGAVGGIHERGSLPSRSRATSRSIRQPPSSRAYRNRSCSRCRRPCQNSTVSGDDHGTRPSAPAGGPRRRGSARRPRRSARIELLAAAEDRCSAPRPTRRAAPRAAASRSTRRTRPASTRSTVPVDAHLAVQLLPQEHETRPCGFSASCRPLRLSWFVKNVNPRSSTRGAARGARRAAVGVGRRERHRVRQRDAGSPRRRRSQLRNCAIGSSSRSEVAAAVVVEPGGSVHRARIGHAGIVRSGVPPAGFEPAHPAPEAGALSPELRGPSPQSNSRRRGASRRPSLATGPERPGRRRYAPSVAHACCSSTTTP